MLCYNCCFLTSIQVLQEANKIVWYSYFFQNCPVCCDPCSQWFSIVNEAEVDVFLEFSCFFNDPTDAGNLISDSSAFYKSICTSGISQCTYCWSLAWRIWNISIWNECNCALVWTFFDIALLWDWNKNWPFPVLWSLLSFPDSSSTGILSRAL